MGVENRPRIHEHNLFQFSSGIMPPQRSYTLKMSLSSIPTVETCGIVIFLG